MMIPFENTKALPSTSAVGSAYDTISSLMLPCKTRAQESLGTIPIL